MTPYKLVLVYPANITHSSRLIGHSNCLNKPMINALHAENILRKKATTHDDVIKWKHFPRYWSFVRGIRRSPHKGQYRGALMFSLICDWSRDWGNNRDPGDERRHRADYDVTVMLWYDSLHCRVINSHGMENMGWIWHCLPHERISEVA